MSTSRRGFIKGSVAAVAGLSITSMACGEPLQAESPSHSSDETRSFDISLAQWSLHRTLGSGKMDNLDFAVAARMVGA